MKNKILVDVTNSSVRGEDLHGMLGLTGARWVKAFNDNGAVDILLDKPFSKKSMVTNICGRSMDAVDKVKSFAEEALGFSAKIVPVDQYQEIAMNQDSFRDDWVHATYIILVLFVLTELYAILRYNVFKGYAWYHLPIQVTNKAICWTALNGFALTMLPGLLARMYDAFHYSKMLDKPKLIRFGLKVRKALGLLALWFLGIHIFMSLLIFNPKYYSKVRIRASRSLGVTIQFASYFLSFSPSLRLRARNSMPLEKAHSFLLFWVLDFMQFLDFARYLRLDLK